MGNGSGNILICLIFGDTFSSPLTCVLAVDESIKVSYIGKGKTLLLAPYNSCFVFAAS